VSELNDVEPSLFDVETDLIAMELSLIDVASKVIVVEGSQIDGVSGLIDVEPLRTGDASAVLVEESRLRDQTRLSGQDAFPDSKRLTLFSSGIDHPIRGCEPMNHIRLWHLLALAAMGQGLALAQVRYSLASRPKFEICPDTLYRQALTSADTTYGYSPKNPVRTGGGPSGERRYLDMLQSARGDTVDGYLRTGSVGGVGKKGLPEMIDRYELLSAGRKVGRTIYVDMYSCDTLKAPIGFRIVPEK